MRMGIEGISVGHYTDLDGGTGCTVVLAPAGATASVDVRGGGPGTRETDILSPLSSIESVHAVLLTGGSAFGIAAEECWMKRGFGAYQMKLGGGTTVVSLAVVNAIGDVLNDDGSILSGAFS